MATTLDPGTGVPSSWAGAVTRVDSAQKYPLGQHRYEKGRWYKYVKFNNGVGNVASVAFDVALYYLLDGYKNNEVTMDLTDIGIGGAGVFQAIIPDGEFGWIQIKGAATLTSALVDVTDSAPQTPTGAGDGTLDINIATAANTHICAWSGDVSDKEIMCDFPW